MGSAGSSEAMQRATVRPPMPESKMPMGLLLAGETLGAGDAAAEGSNPSLGTSMGAPPWHFANDAAAFVARVPLAHKKPGARGPRPAVLWWAMRDSNPRPCACKAPALATAPIARRPKECSTGRRAVVVGLGLRRLRAGVGGSAVRAGGVRGAEPDVRSFPSRNAAACAFRSARPLRPRRTELPRLAPAAPSPVSLAPARLKPVA